MRLIHYLKEDYKLMSVSEIYSMIKKDCKPWLKAARDGIVYRGMRKKDYIFKGKTRTERIPMNTSMFVHDEFDKATKELFGWKARSAGLFVTGNFSEAKMYGPVFSIWPIGPIKYLWSDEVRDFYDFEYLFNDDSEGEEINIQDWIESQYMTSNLNRAIKSNVEIMVKCKEYYAVNDQEYGFELAKVRRK